MSVIKPLDATDLEGYFQRIGYSGVGDASQDANRAPTLATLQGIHRRHPEAIARLPNYITPIPKRPNRRGVGVAEPEA